MGTEIQDKEIRGITGKIVITIVLAVISIVSTFEVGYFKVISKLELMQIEKDNEKKMNQYILDGINQHLDLLDRRFKEMDDWRSNVKNKNK
jgi:hypothetical protein